MTLAQAWRRLRHLDRPRTADAGAVAGGNDGPLLDEDLLRQIQRLGLLRRDALTEWLMGEHTGQRKTQALEFDDYRGYVPGDDLRLIDWNAYSRLGELYVKTSLAPETINLSLLLDTSRSMDWGEPNRLRYGKRLAAALGAIALLRGDRVQLFALGDGMAFPREPLHGPGQLLPLTEALEALPAAASTNLVRSIAAYQRAVDQRGIVVLISDLLVPADGVSALADLRAEGTEAAVLHLVDSAEAQPAMRGPMELLDAESGERARLTLTPALRQRYLERFQARERSLAAVCAAAGIAYVRVPTSVPVVEVLAGALRAEELLQV